jgi:hypothetical protein
MTTKEEILKDIHASLRASIRAEYEKDGRPFTEADLNWAEYEIMGALARRHLGGGPILMGEKE